MSLENLPPFYVREAGIQGLIHNLRSPIVQVRQLAAKQLATLAKDKRDDIRSANGIPPVVALLDSDDSETKQAAFFSLSWYGQNRLVMDQYCLEALWGLFCFLSGSSRRFSSMR